MSSSSHWFFKLPSNIEGLEGFHPLVNENKDNDDRNNNNKLNNQEGVRQLLFRTVMRKFIGAAAKSPASNQNQNQSFQSDGAQSVGSIPVAGSVSSVRCGGMTFGVQADDVAAPASSDITKNNERQVTFNISCASLESANHGVCVGLAPQDVKLDTPMVWDEPNVLMINCTSTGATVWSEHMGEYGTKISDKCLIGGDDAQNPNSSRFEGKIHLWWNVENGAVRFDIFDPNEKKIVVASAARDYFSKRTQYSAENLEKMFASLRPTIAFSTVVNEDRVSLS